MIKRVFLVFIFISLATPCLSEPWSDVFRKEQVDWNKWDLSIPDSMKQRLLDVIKTSHPSYTLVQEHLHIIDFNNDGTPDIIYNGPAGPESNVIILQVNNGGSYEDTFVGWGQLVALEKLTGWSPLRFRVFNYACCGDMRHFIEEYVPSLKNGKLSYVLAYRVLVDVRTKLPQTFFDDHIIFEVARDKCSLRTEPIIDDEVFETEWGYAKGNAIASYPPGSVGKAISSFHDNAGNIWWLVIMNPSTNLDWELFNHHKSDNSNEKAAMSGWMNSSFLKVK